MEPSKETYNRARRLWHEMFPPARDWKRVKPGDRIEAIALELEKVRLEALAASRDSSSST